MKPSKVGAKMGRPETLFEQVPEEETEALAETIERRILGAKRARVEAIEAERHQERVDAVLEARAKVGARAK